MKHKKIQKKLLRYIDGELPPTEKAEVQRHLQHCGRCRRDLQLLSGAWSSRKQPQRVRPPAYLWNRISEQLTAETREEWSVRRIAFLLKEAVRPALTVVVILLGMFIGIKIGNHLLPAGLAARQNSLRSGQVRTEFGLENFRLLSSGSLDHEMAAFMGYEE